ncbi:MAG: N-acetylglucosamine-6-phosphate deacetylase [Eubacteriales bacterium]|nr:N-acetylglucosamine-6-phosphate deacetylase [Eubacteriales bacterium]
MIFKNAFVFKEDNNFYIDNIYIKEDLFVGEDSLKDSQIDATGLYAIPGLIDIHFHGANGYDFCDATNESLSEISKYEALHGVTGICIASMSLAFYELKKIMQNANLFYNKKREENEADFLGINMEGPFLSKEQKGAQNEKYLIDINYDFYKELQDISGNIIKIVDIAPEISPSEDFIKKVSKEIVVSLAHTNCDYDKAIEAFNYGASHITHLYNAMPSLHHRKPGIISAAFDKKNIKVEIITDGVHVSSPMIRLALQIFGEDNVIIISDSLRQTGLNYGEFDFTNQKVIVKNNACYLLNNTLAGSITNLYDCMKYAIKEAKIKKEIAIAMATKNPAKEIGVYDKYGSIEIGKVANFILVDEKMNIQKIILRGKIIFNRQ